MTQDILTVAGEEYVTKNGLDGATITYGLYYDPTDNVTDSDYDPATVITTEPTNTDYARQSVTMSEEQTATDVWGVASGSTASFDFSDTSSADKVDTLFAIINFNSSYAGGTANHIIATLALVNEHTIGNVNSIDFAAGEIEINLS